jgi:hypothetical protein
MKKISYVLFMLFSTSAFAEKIITIESTITGSQEQPKVISIVPWQKPEDPNYFGQEVTGAGSIPKDFRSLDRESFVRELEYISVMRKNTQK